MMLNLEQKKILAYLPHPRDPYLDKDEYYVQDTAERIHKVYIVDLLPHEQTLEYGVVEVGTGRRVNPWYGAEWRGFRMADLYDNKDDCRNREHSIFDGWEDLRRIQLEKYPDIYKEET